MRTSALFLCLSLLVSGISATIIEDDIDELKSLGFQYLRNNFGDIEMVRESIDYIEKVIIPAATDIYSSPSLYEAMTKRITSVSKEQVNQALITCSKGNYADFFKIASTKVGQVGTKGAEKVTLTRRPDDCFERVDVSFKKNSNYEVQVTFQAYNQTSANCTEVFVVGSALNVHVVTINKNTTHSFKFTYLTRKQMKNIETYGIQIFRTCDKLSNLLPDLLWTVGLFMGGFGLNPDTPFFGSKPTRWQEVLNVEFIKHATGYQWQPRKDVFVDLNETDLRSGDFLAITRFDGLDQLIEWGANTHSGHSAVLLEVDGVMYVVESQDGWYWPKKNIQRNTWKEWKKYAHNAGFNVAVLPLSPESRAKFNVTAAVEWFKSVEGMPYGYHNFLFGWIDTPDQNFPPILHPDFAAVVFSILEQLWFIPSIENPMRKLIGEALNKRLNTTNLTIAEMSQIVAERGLTFGQVFAMVEQDGWMYSDGYSYVCSAFAAGLYKAGGLLPKDINAVEFTPYDVYSLNIYDRNYTKPVQCQGVDSDLPYCQIMGNWKMHLNDYNTISPYSHMCETCPTQPPGYIRPPRC